MMYRYDSEGSKARKNAQIVITEDNVWCQSTPSDVECAARSTSKEAVCICLYNDLRWLAYEQVQTSPTSQEDYNHAFDRINNTCLFLQQLQQLESFAQTTHIDRYC